MHYGLGDYLLDLTQNAIQAGADAVTLKLSDTAEYVAVVVEDTGAGMDEMTQERALDPFYSDGIKHPDRRVGLGLPFVRQLAEATGGRFGLRSSPGRGTRVEFELPAKHPDIPPFSDPAGCFTALLAMSGEHEMVIERVYARGGYTLRRSELREALGELESVGSQVLLREYIESQEGT